MLLPDRRRFLALAGSGLASAGLAAWPAPLLAAGPVLAFMTAGQGSAFLPYGQGVAAAVNAAGVATLEVKESKGSIENLSAVEATATTIGTAFLGSAYEALNGIGPFAGKPHGNLRALVPMYETAFHVAAKTSSGIASIRALDGRRVGVGPASGPAEAFFKGLAEVTGIRPVLVTGTPAELSKAYLEGGIDAFWQGASIPVPSLVAAVKDSDSIVFGLTAEEVDGMLKRFPYLARSLTPTGVYKGQTGPIASVAAWNIIVAHKDMPVDLAHALARAILTAPDLTKTAGAAASGTKAANAPVNSVIPYHAGAAKYLAEAGIKVETR